MNNVDIDDTSFSNDSDGSAHHALVPVHSSSNSNGGPVEGQWRPIFHNTESNQVVLYNPTSHAVAVSNKHSPQPNPPYSCPYCKQPLPNDELEAETFVGEQSGVRASNYFRLLEQSRLEAGNNGIGMDDFRTDGEGENRSRPGVFPAGSMAEGYFKAFFQEECKLGVGANGSVFLCQHMLDGSPLGHFAVKKIAVGESHTYLLDILREVRLLERLHHPNIIVYHHAWLETCQFSSFGPKVPTLHVLMQWAEGGSLDDFIDVRLGRQTRHNFLWHNWQSRPNPFDPSPSTSPTRSPTGTSTAETPQDETPNSRAAKIRAFRAYQNAERSRLGGNGRAKGGGRAIHLLSADEIKGIFTDVVEGLAFLHSKSILHLDLKPGNVLLTWDDGRMIPRAMLSDFGTSRDMMASSRVRSGNTGTLEYTSPESLPSPRTGLLSQIDSKADMWSLGMVLHKMVFFKLPYRYASRGNESGEAVTDERDKMLQLEQEILSYPGFRFTQQAGAAFEARKMPRGVGVLLEALLDPRRESRPTCDRVLVGIKAGWMDPSEGEFKKRRGRQPGNHPIGEEYVPERPGAGRTRTQSLPHLPLPLLPPTPDSESSESEELVFHDAVSSEEKVQASLLELPAPPITPQGQPRVLGSSIWVMNILGKNRAIVRTIKAIILVIKVLQLYKIPTQSPAPFVLGLAVAIPDLWTDSLRLTAWLAAGHGLFTYIVWALCKHL